MAGVKVCTKCKAEFPLTNFYRYAPSRDGYRGQCKQCISVYHERRRDKVATYMSEYNFRQYGITAEDYADMLVKQGHVCAICGNPEAHLNRNGVVKALAVDHSHETGKVRGLLCHRCNTALGLLGDSVDVLSAAAMYLLANEDIHETKRDTYV